MNNRCNILCLKRVLKTHQHESINSNTLTDPRMPDINGGKEGKGSRGERWREEDKGMDGREGEGRVGEGRKREEAGERIME